MNGGTEKIDCQSHLFCSGLLTLMERRADDPVVFIREGIRHLRMGDWLRRVPPHYCDAERKLQAMDAAGVARAALSINDPGPEWFGTDAPAVARMANDFIAATVARYPSRFFGLGVFPLPDVPASLAELDRCARQLGFKGMLLYTNLAGAFPDESRFRPIFARLEELGLPVLLHPAKPITTAVVKDYEMTSSLGNMFDSTIALTRLILAGILDEFPRLKLVCPHLGGTLPYIVGRIDHQIRVLKRGPQNLKRAPSEYLRGIWFDIVSPLPAAMRFACDFLGPGRLLFASDHPWVEPALIRDCLDSLALPSSVTERIYRQNAMELFALDA